MKKILLLIAATILLGTIVSCSDNDEPKRGDGVFTVNTPMVNHMYNTVTNQVIGMANTRNKLTLDTTHHTAQLELLYNDGSNHTVSYQDLTARASRLGFYVLRSPGDPNFSGYVDFNEGAMRYIYTTADGIRIISTMPDVFILNTENTIEYDDTTETTKMGNVMYQFNLNPRDMTAIVKVMDIVHAKDLRRLTTVTATTVPVTLTSNGYVFSGQNLTTTARYTSWTDSVSGPTEKSTDEYPFKTFNVNVDLIGDHMDAHYMLGPHATVTATGKTYPDYTSY